MNKLKEVWNLTGVPILVASLCCLAPVILVALGISTVAFAASLTQVLDGKYRWLFDLAGILSLVISLTLYFRKRGICTLDQAKKHRNEIINKTIIALIVCITGYFLFFNLLLNWIGVQLKIWN